MILRSKKVHYTLRNSLLKIVIKNSFTEDFYVLQAFPSGEMKNYSSSVMSRFYLS